MGARESILGSVRRAMRRGPLEGPVREAAAARLDRPQRNPIPDRAAALPLDERLDLFVALARGADATVDRVDGPDDVPGAVSAYLKAQNLPATVRAAPDESLDKFPWHRAGTLELRRGKAIPSDAVGLAAAFAGVAETGTLMLHSGPGNPTTLNFLPDTEVVVLSAADVVASYEDGWDRLRRKFGPRAMPRTVNFVTGPSRSADIEQTLQLGAHGPQRLHIVVHGQAR